MDSTQTNERHKSVAKPKSRRVFDPVATAPGSVFVDPQKDLTLASGYETASLHALTTFCAKSSVDGLVFADRIANSEGQAQNIQTKEMARHTWERRRES